jgi:hypothetical protein
MNAIVGSTGLIGSYLKEVVQYTHEFNSDNILDISNYSFNTVYVAAPTGNRLLANADPRQDSLNVRRLYDAVSKTQINELIIIGTVDSILRPNLPYGSNRLWLEENLSNLFNTYILRLSSLIHSRITKNVLFDLKHHQYLDHINLNSKIQWYDLNNLGKDIHFSIISNQRVRNLVSEPIYNSEIVKQFFPTLELSANEVVNQSVDPWCYTKEEIFQAMKKYLNE